MPDPPRDARILVLLNPGQMSRNWLQGIASGAERLGCLAGTLELAPIWSAIEGSTPQTIDDVRNQIAGQVIRFCQQRRVTHVVSYLHNGAFEPGLFPDETNQPVTLFARAGIRHIMLWSDHPNWALEGAALHPTVAEILAHPKHTHILKSPSAAKEAAEVLRWPNTHAMHMGENFNALQPVQDVEVIHDAVIIMADTMHVPAPLIPHLDEERPNPRELSAALRTDAIIEFRNAVKRHLEGDLESALCNALADDWLDAKLARPHEPLHDLIPPLKEDHADAFKILKRDPRFYYDALTALQTVTAWRRFFWPAWLAKRANVGIYGSPCDRMGVPLPPGGGLWIPNAAQPEIYARGKVAININAGHDEAGLTHKPFQIAASGVPCLHFHSKHLDECFTPGQEIMTFDNGPDLHDAILELSANDKKRTALAEAIRERGMADHDWANRVVTMLALAEKDAQRPAARPAVQAA